MRYAAILNPIFAWSDAVIDGCYYCCGVSFFDQGAGLMGKYGINVPKGVAVASLHHVQKALQYVFPSESEVIWISLVPNICKDLDFSFPRNVGEEKKKFSHVKLWNGTISMEEKI